PDHCSILVDRRTLPGETDAGVRRELQALLRKRGLSALLTGTKLYPCLPLETDPRLPLVAGFLSCTGQRKPAGVHYYCDASVLARAGIPSVAFGPGDIAQAHTRDEWIETASLERARAILTGFLQNLA